MRTSNKGFASMQDKERHIEICRKGGLSVSRNREYMQEIGRRGGEKSASIRKKKAGV